MNPTLEALLKPPPRALAVVESAEDVLRESGMMSNKSRAITGAVIGLALSVGIYAAAAGAASNLATAFITAETVSHQRNADFSRAAELASSEHNAERSRCEAHGAKARRSLCNAEAKLKNARRL
jgi:hypothetical protein